MGGINRMKQLKIAGPLAAAGLCAIFLIEFSQPADAQTRRQPNTVELTCRQTHELISRFGAINLRSGPVRFDRYVTSRASCFSNQTLRTTNVPTKDQPKCPVQICVDPRRNTNNN